MCEQECIAINWVCAYVSFPINVGNVWKCTVRESVQFVIHLALYTIPYIQYLLGWTETAAASALLSHIIVGILARLIKSIKAGNIQG